MTKRHLFESLKTKLFCRVKPSNIEGVGVFAIKNIPKGTKLFETYFSNTDEGLYSEKWYCYTTGEIDELEDGVKKLIYDYCENTEGEIAISSNMPRDIDGGCIYLLNHSCFPNVKFTYPEGLYYTTRDIDKGEELCFNYRKDFKKAREKIKDWTE